MKSCIILCALCIGLALGENNNPDKKGKMTCQEYVDDFHERRKNGERMPADMELPDCDENGDYVLKQCYGSWTGRGHCGCVKRYSGERMREYSGTLYREGRQMTCQCAYDQLYTQRNLDCNMVTGDFKEVRCSGSRCFCAERTGEPIIGYISFNDGDSNCMCARREHDHKNSGAPPLTFNCHKDGSFKPKQYRGSKVMCVDEMGRVVKGPVPVSTGIDC